MVTSYGGARTSYSWAINSYGRVVITSYGGAITSYSWATVTMRYLTFAHVSLSVWDGRRVSSGVLHIHVHWPGPTGLASWLAVGKRQCSSVAINHYHFIWLGYNQLQLAYTQLWGGYNQQQLGYNQLYGYSPAAACYSLDVTGCIPAAVPHSMAAFSAGRPKESQAIGWRTWVRGGTGKRI